MKPLGLRTFRITFFEDDGLQEDDDYMESCDDGECDIDSPRLRELEFYQSRENTQIETKLIEDMKLYDSNWWQRIKSYF